MRRLYILIVLSVTAFGFSSGTPVYACSGGVTETIESLLARVDYIVKADVVAVDDVRQNALLAIDSYLFGGAGPEYVLMVQNDPVIITRMTEGDPYGACNFFKPELHAGLSAYFSLTRRADGVYQPSTQWLAASYYAFPTAESTITFYSQEDDNYVAHVLAEDDFVRFITTHGASTLTEPDANSAFPRPAPIRITTDSGSQYLLPVDTMTPLEASDDFLHMMGISVMGYESVGWFESYFHDSDCPAEGCSQVSPDGINRATQHNNEIRWLGGRAPGRAFQFSATGDAIAIWHEDQITFYTLGWKKRDQPFSEVLLLNRVTLRGDIDTLPDQGAWSPDGRIFAYSDTGGLWSVDVYQANAEPLLLSGHTEQAIPLALAYSPLGRYLQVQQGAERYTLDTVSGELHPDGLVSPDDQILLAYDTQAESFTLAVCPLAPIHECQVLPPSVLQTPEDEARVFIEYTQVQWRNGYSFLVTTCERDTPTDCLVKRIENRGWGGVWYAQGPFWTEGYGFAHLPQGDILAVIQDTFTLWIDGETLDLSAALDSEIVGIDWLPSAFYSAAPRR